jgi:hypothetical protein
MRPALRAAPGTMKYMKNTPAGPLSRGLDRSGRSRLAAMLGIFLLGSLIGGCRHVQPLDAKPLYASGLSYDASKKLEAQGITAAEIAEIAKVRSAGMSDEGCLQVYQISHARGEPFTAGDGVAGLIRVGMREQDVLELARMNQLGLGVGELQAMHLAGLSDAIILEVARHHAAGKPALSGASLASMKNAGLRESTLYELARRGVPDSQVAAIIAYRRHGAKDVEILRRFAGS